MKATTIDKIRALKAAGVLIANGKSYFICWALHSVEGRDHSLNAATREICRYIERELVGHATLKD